MHKTSYSSTFHVYTPIIRCTATRSIEDAEQLVNLCVNYHIMNFNIICTIRYSWSTLSTHNNKSIYGSKLLPESDWPLITLHIIKWLQIFVVANNIIFMNS